MERSINGQGKKRGIICSDEDEKSWEENSRKEKMEAEIEDFENRKKGRE